jgi:hypothetical protein
VTAFLERVGAAFDVTIRVYQDDVLSHVMELYYLDQRPFEEGRVARAGAAGRAAHHRDLA